MKKIERDENYQTLVYNILNKEEFQKVKQERHHGIDRYTHSLDVSYKTYKIAKALKLDYKAAARAGLLHDFFIKEDIEHISFPLLKHPKIAADKSRKHFNVSEMEYDLIETHMFPRTIKPPRHIEGWILIVVDTYVSGYETLRRIVFNAPLVANVFIAFLLSI